MVWWWSKTLSIFQERQSVVDLTLRTRYMSYRLVRFTSSQNERTKLKTTRPMIYLENYYIHSQYNNVYIEIKIIFYDKRNAERNCLRKDLLQIDRQPY